MSTPRADCAQCGASADSDRVFCAKCGAVIHDPVSSLVYDSAHTDAVPRVSFLKRAIILSIKAIGIIAALTFWFSGLSTNFGILLFGASIVVGGLCLGALSYLDDDFFKDHMKNVGYWPSKPIDWGTPRNDSTAEKPTDSADH